MKSVEWNGGEGGCVIDSFKEGATASKKKKKREYCKVREHKKATEVTKNNWGKYLGVEGWGENFSRK